MVTKIEKLTFDQWLNLPETMEHYEIEDGVRYLSPGATVFHQRVMRRVANPLSDFVEAHGLGEVFTPPMDVLISREPLRIRQPDVLFLSAGRAVIGGPEEAMATKFLEMPPDLVVEVWSPSDTRSVLERKLRDYQAIEVPECWVFHTADLTASILDLTGREPRVVATLGTEDTFRSDLLPGFELSLAQVFA